jgi:hypothetical protein
VSKSKVVLYGERGFWAYDIVLGVFVKYLIDVVEATRQAHTPFLAEAIPEWRLAVLYDFALTLKESWTPIQRQNVIDFAEQAGARLAMRASISTEEIVSWPFAGHEHIFHRGLKEVRTAPVIKLGRAFIALLRDEVAKSSRRRSLVIFWHRG